MTDVLAHKYRSLFVIGRGGMGAVEAALESGADRIVALKRLLPGGARDARRSAMFLREAKVAALLSHPNVVRAFDYGEADGELFLAMEYIEGQTLAVFLRALAEPLSAGMAAHVLADVCEGLHAAHELVGADGASLQLVHRDVSPQNVMIGYDGRVRLLDFGVAKIEAESVTTKTGEVKGKTAYMSPEQAMGDAVDRRSDLFGVGALLYECLTLRRMWGEGTDMDVIRKLALEEPPPLESAPPTLRAIYKSLVERKAEDRPDSAHEVAMRLRSLAPTDGALQLVDAMAAHFSEQAAAQRQKLEDALETVAPALRPSKLPGRNTVPALAPPKETMSLRVGWSAPLALLIAVAVAVTAVAWVRRSARPLKHGEPVRIDVPPSTPPSPKTQDSASSSSMASEMPPAVASAARRPNPSVRIAPSARWIVPAVPSVVPSPSTTNHAPRLDEKPF